MIGSALWTIVFGLYVSNGFAAEPPGGYYVTKYDHLDVDALINQKRLVHYYANCMVNKGPCPPQGAELKQILPEALRTNCMRCTDKQKTIAYRSIRRLRKEYPHVYKEMVEFYDPNEEHVQSFEAGFQKNGVLMTTTTTTMMPTMIPTTMPVTVGNRFGDEENNEIPQGTNIYPPPRKPCKTTKKPNRTYPPPTIVVTEFSKTTVKKMATTKRIITTRSPTMKPTTKPTIGTTRSPTIKTTVGTTTRSPITLRPVLTFASPTTSTNLFSSFNHLGNKFLEAGTKVAEMLLQTVQALVGKRT